MARTVEVPEYEVHERVSVDPSRAALLVIDMQNDFVKEGGTLVVPDAEGRSRESLICSSSRGRLG